MNKNFMDGEIIEAAVVHSEELEQAVIQEVGVEGEFEGIPEKIEERKSNPSLQPRKKRKATARRRKDM